MKVIAISGWKQSGKDTVAEYLVKECGYIRFSFADALKNMVSRQYGIPRDHCDDPAFKERPIEGMPVVTHDKFGEMIHNFMQKGFRAKEGEGEAHWTPRALCILEGSVKRSARSNYWVRTTLDNIYKKDAKLQTIHSEVFAVISDLRYHSEIEQLRKAFGSDLTTVRINRFKTSPSNDPSERDLDDEEFDILIENKGTLQELYQNIEQLIKEH